MTQHTLRWRRKEKAIRLECAGARSNTPRVRWPYDTAYLEVAETEGEGVLEGARTYAWVE